MGISPRQERGLPVYSFMKKISDEKISQPLIKPDRIESRSYQLSLAEKALTNNSLIVLPTGLGKTIISLIVVASRLSEFKEGKALILSPTKPLVEQHTRFFRDSLNIREEEILTFTGELSPDKREEMWKRGKVIVSTPQVIENDLITRRIDLEDVVQITFDEAHRSVGNYSYVYIAKRYLEEGKNVNIMGITASPGSDKEKIREVCENLHIEKIEIKDESDPSVFPYVYDRSLRWVRVEMSEGLKEIRDLLTGILDDRMKKLKDLGMIGSYAKDLSKKELLGLQNAVRKKLIREPSSDLFSAVSILAEILKLKHAVDLAETQGFGTLTKYLERLKNEGVSKGGSKAAKRTIGDKRFTKALYLSENMDEKNPKMEEVKRIISNKLMKNKDSRIIVFTNYRDTAKLVVKDIEELEGARPIRFVGQANREGDNGLRQSQQVEIIEKFKSGEYNVLVATSVGEEGLDIPSTDLVIFYEPVPSEIRSIQRKGRTARRRSGEVVILMTRGTRDEAYYWISNRKEKEMKRVGRENHLVQRQEDQKKVADFDEEAVEVIVDHRELRSAVTKNLEEKGLRIKVKTLNVGDYVVSDRVCIERKTDIDLLDSLFTKERDIFKQMSNLRRAYERPILLIEGEDLYTRRNVHPNAIRGALSSIIVDFGVSILMSRDSEDTAGLIYSMARREQKRNRRLPSLHDDKTSKTVREKQEYLVSSLPNVGLQTAKSLLFHFGSVRSVFNARKEELMEVENVGEKTAVQIRKVIDEKY